MKGTSFKNMKKSIKVTFYEELKKGTIVRAIATGISSQPFLIIRDNRSIGTFATITNLNGKTYLVWEQV